MGTGTTELERVVEVIHLKPYFELAQDVAKESECTRRQYGSVIAGNDFYLAWASNSRVTKCCNGNLCARDRLHIRHGQRTEVGAEIHSEIACLLKAGGLRTEGTQFVMVGFSNDKELFGTTVYPCHNCAVALRYAGFTHIYIHHDPDNIIPVSVADIIAFREQEWEAEN